MLAEDTDIGVYASCDTLGVKLTPGEAVVCIGGEMKGVRGVLVANRTDGRVLVRVAQGMYVELPRICLKKDG